MTLPGSPLRRALLLTLLALLLAGLAYSSVYRAAWSEINRSDYNVYLAAGQAVLDHTDLYEAQNVRGWKYVYPPPFALLAVPFAQLPLALGALLWFLLLLGAIVAASRMSLALLAPLPDRDRWPLLVLPLLALFEVLIAGLIRGQASVLMFGLIIATFYCHFRGRWLGAGFSLAAAALLKVFPLALLAYFAWRRQWRTIAATLAGLVVLGLLLPSLFFGWQQNLHHYERWYEAVARPALMSNAERSTATPLFEQLMDTRKHRNQSLEALFLSAGVPAATTQVAVRGTALGMLALMLAAAARVRSRDDELALASAFIAWSLLIPPISETHYFGALLLPLTVLLARVRHDAGLSATTRRWLVRGGVGAMLVVMTMLHFHGTGSWRPLCLATLLLWAGALYSIGRRQVAPVPPPTP